MRVEEKRGYDERRGEEKREVQRGYSYRFLGIMRVEEERGYDERRGEEMMREQNKPKHRN